MERPNFLNRYFKSRIQGHVDFVDGRYIGGWAVNRGMPSLPVEIIVERNGVQIGKGRADLCRPDLLAHAPAGRCAFLISVDLEVAIDDVTVFANGILLSRSGSNLANSSSKIPARFEPRTPSHQNAVDIFRGSWASDLSPILPNAVSGLAAHFSADPRPQEAANLLGMDGRLDGMRVLELGPLEGGHTYLLENLGADVLAIEANQDAFLKCLITKEISRIQRSQFMLGDFAEFLRTTNQRFDLVFAVGVLYHMADPIGIIKDICRVTDRCFVWTHVYDSQTYKGPPRIRRQDSRLPTAELWEADYGKSMNDKKFWGGNRQTNCWMRQDDIFTAFRQYGLDHHKILDRSIANGHAVISFAAMRDRH